MNAEYELLPDGTVEPRTRRKVEYKSPPGRPRGYSPKKAAAMNAKLDADEGLDGEEDETTSLSVRKSRAALSKAEADAANAWLKHKIDSGEYLSRTAFREACATVLAEIAQGLRSLPDMLERRHGLAPEVVLAVEQTIDEMLADSASSLEMFVQEPIDFQK